MCFAAVLGFEHGRMKPLDPSTMEIDGRTFENHQQSLDLVYLVALAHAKNVEVLREDSENRAIEIFEGYAEGGFEVLAGWLKEKPQDENGDEAILEALGKYGFLQTIREVDAAASDVEF